jgi:hypothetical protein
MLYGLLRMKLPTNLAIWWVTDARQVRGLTATRAIRHCRLSRETIPDPGELVRRRFLHGRIMVETRVAAERHGLLRGADLLDRGGETAL